MIAGSSGHDTLSFTTAPFTQSNPILLSEATQQNASLDGGELETNMQASYSGSESLFSDSDSQKNNTEPDASESGSSQKNENDSIDLDRPNKSDGNDSDCSTDANHDNRRKYAKKNWQYTSNQQINYLS